jgi:hypothetical protein
MKNCLDNIPMWFRAKNKVGNLQLFEILNTLCGCFGVIFITGSLFNLNISGSNYHSLTHPICLSYKLSPSPNRFITFVKMEAACSSENS